LGIQSAALLRGGGIDIHVAKMQYSFSGLQAGNVTTMKSILVVFVGILGIAGAFAQGSVLFANRIVGAVITHVYLPSSTSPDLVQIGNGTNDFPAGAMDWTGWTPVSGSGFSAQLFAAAGADVPVENLVPAFPITTFRTGLAAGFVSGAIATLTDVLDYAPVATIQMRAWDNRGGTIPDWATAIAQPAGAFELVGMSAPFNVTHLGGGPLPNPPSLVGLQSFNLVGTPTIHATLTNFATGYPVTFLGSSTGQAVWDFGDGTFTTNQAVVSHAWSAPGIYTLRLTGDTNSNPGSLSASAMVTVQDAVYYVNPTNPNPSAPYTNWQTAATNIQDAINAGLVTGRFVLVSDGTYRTGIVEVDGTNRVALTNPVVVKSINGPQATLIEGDTNGVRCAWVGNGAIFSGFTVANGTALGDGGGVLCESGGNVTNCVLTGNTASARGGAAYSGTLNRCVLTGNSAGGDGGAAYNAHLYNCTVAANSAQISGGGAYGGTLHNCVLFTNSAAGYGAGACAYASLYNCTLIANSGLQSVGGAEGCTVYNSIIVSNRARSAPDYAGGYLEYCCTTQLPASGVGNISADPLFVNAAAGDFRLSPNSPCIDAGTNLADLLTTDIQGLPRLMDGNDDGIAVVDMGAY
jgi:PKD repeat protein